MDSHDSMPLFAAKVLASMRTNEEENGQLTPSPSTTYEPIDLSVIAADGPLPLPGSSTPIFHPGSALWERWNSLTVPVQRIGIQAQVENCIERARDVRKCRCDMLGGVTKDLLRDVLESKDPWREKERLDIVDELTDLLCFGPFAKPPFNGCEQAVRALLDRLFLGAFAGSSPDEFAVYDCLQMEEGLETLLDAVFQRRPWLQPAWWQERDDHFDKRLRIYLELVASDGSTTAGNQDNSAEDMDVDIAQSTGGELCPYCRAITARCMNCEGFCPGRLRPCCALFLCPVCAHLLTGHECPDCDPSLSGSSDSGPDMDVDEPEAG